MAKESMVVVLAALFAIAITVAMLGQVNASLAADVWSRFTQMVILVVGGSIAVTIVVKIVFKN
jgi:hypothetical protein